jgi:AraC family transcriptional regulator of adaptative response/methylated-DNA-[protein]-cysteine methyltransferase
MQGHADFSPSDDYRRIASAIQFIEDHFQDQPTLDQIAASVHLSRYHFDRLFKRWAGISPKQFLQFLTLEYTKQQLAESKSLLDTSLEAGLSGPSRLHDLFVTFEAMTPGEFKHQGRGLNITYGFGSSPFGVCLLATTPRGICHLGFVDANHRSEARDALFQMWPGAVFNEAAAQVAPIARAIFHPAPLENPRPFNLHLRGTNFQINVWKALVCIPAGRVVSYQDIAALIGRPRAFRAAANAIAINPVAYLIPCHRVIAKSGKIHRYRWGALRKKAIIGWEAAQQA